MKGNYRFGNVQRALDRRLASLYHPQWVDAIVYLIRASDCRFFRWHDSGDVQSLAHLLNIVRVAELLPQVKFWLPTREKKIVLDYKRTFKEFPRNLVVRVSAAMVDAGPPAGFTHTSSVYRKGVSRGRACPAHEQHNRCADCRACWDRRVRHVSYRFH
jgi:hypothetical protein